MRFDGSDHAAKAELLDLLLEASRDGIVDWNLHTGETVYDPRWKHLLGSTARTWRNTTRRQAAGVS